MCVAAERYKLNLTERSIKEKRKYESGWEGRNYCKVCECVPNCILCSRIFSFLQHAMAGIVVVISPASMHSGLFRACHTHTYWNIRYIKSIWINGIDIISTLQPVSASYICRLNIASNTARARLYFHCIRAMCECVCIESNTNIDDWWKCYLMMTME